MLRHVAFTHQRLLWYSILLVLFLLKTRRRRHYEHRLMPSLYCYLAEDRENMLSLGRRWCHEGNMTKHWWLCESGLCLHDCLSLLFTGDISRGSRKLDDLTRTCASYARSSSLGGLSFHSQRNFDECCADSCIWKATGESWWCHDTSSHVCNHSSNEEQVALKPLQTWVHIRKSSVV